MSEVNDVNQKHIVKNIVDNAVIGNTDTVTVPAFQLSVALWSWVIGKALDGLFDIGIIWLVDILQGFDNLFL